MVISSVFSGGVLLWGLNLEGGKRVSLGGKNGPTGPCSSVGGSQPLGGRESEVGYGRRRTSWLSTGFGGWRPIEMTTSACFWRP